MILSERNLQLITWTKTCPYGNMYGFAHFLYNKLKRMYVRQLPSPYMFLLCSVFFTRTSLSSKISPTILRIIFGTTPEAMSTHKVVHDSSAPVVHIYSCIVFRWINIIIQELGSLHMFSRSFSVPYGWGTGFEYREQKNSLIGRVSKWFSIPSPFFCF